MASHCKSLLHTKHLCLILSLPEPNPRGWGGRGPGTAPGSAVAGPLTTEAEPPGTEEVIRGDDKAAGAAQG